MFGRVLRTGLSSLRDRAANLRCRLAALRFNPSRCAGYAMMAAPFVGMWTFAFLTLTPLQALSVVVLPFGVLAWLALAIGLVTR